MKCKNCNVQLIEKNCYPSDLCRGGYVCKECRNKKYKQNITKEAQKRYSKVKNLKLKNSILEAYGNECVCCGESSWSFLTIDHKNNNGNLERKINKISAGLPTYQFLKNKNFPQNNYQLLCSNCNSCKGFHGFCSHNLSKGFFCTDCGESFKESTRFSKRFSFYEAFNYALCKSCTIKRKSGSQTKITQSKRDEKSKSLNLRLKLIEGYGYKCQCCGEDNPFFLTIDHIHDNGGYQRRVFNNNMYKFYRWLINNDFPKKDYQLLCYNCNCSKGFFGKCFHNMNNEYKDIKEYIKVIRG